MILDFTCSAGDIGVSSTSGALKCYDNTGTPISGAVVTGKAVTVTAAPTSTPEAQFADGVTLGWGVVLAMVMAYAIHLLRRGL